MGKNNFGTLSGKGEIEGVNNSDPKIMTFMMFTGQAEEAMNFYISLFDQSQVLSITRYGENEAGKEGTVLLAKFSLQGQVFMCSDTYIEHGFGFTPSMSLYVPCHTDEQITNLFDHLSQAGKVLMPLAAYPFSKKFGWVEDKFGVSWQLDLEG